MKENKTVGSLLDLDKGAARAYLGKRHVGELVLRLVVLLVIIAGQQ